MQPRYVIHLVPSTHWDREWYLPFRRFQVRLVRLMDKVIKLLESGKDPYFVLDGQTGMITATQVEADDRDTIQTIKTDRDALKDAITQALAGADALVTLYNLAPLGEYEVNFNFGDVTYNYEEDKASWRAYVMQGWVPKWMYFVKFEGMSEEEAKAMTAEADAAQIEKAQLFGAE